MAETILELKQFFLFSFYHFAYLGICQSLCSLIPVHLTASLFVVLMKTLLPFSLNMTVFIKFVFDWFPSMEEPIMLIFHSREQHITIFCESYCEMSIMICRPNQ